MGKTTNILDLNNRLEKVEKEKVAQNNYNSLKNRPKINGNLLTGDKTGAQLGLAEAQDIGDLSALTTTDKSNCVGAINEINGSLTNLITLTNVTITPQSTGVEYAFIDKPQSKTYSAIFLVCESPSGSSDDYLELWVQSVNASATQAVIRYKANTANLNYNVKVLWI